VGRELRSPVTYAEEQRDDGRTLSTEYDHRVTDWIGLCSVLRPRQHSIGYTGDGFYRSKDPTNSIKVLKESTQSTQSNDDSHESAERQRPLQPTNADVVADAVEGRSLSGPRLTLSIVVH